MQLPLDKESYTDGESYTKLKMPCITNEYLILSPTVTSMFGGNFVGVELSRKNELYGRLYDALQSGLPNRIDAQLVRLGVLREKKGDSILKYLSYRYLPNPLNTSHYTSVQELNLQKPSRLGVPLIHVGECLHRVKVL
ncbi:uncharacterized protein F4812DRAFT_191330 [Daldinia caldariorum]|uniref:uncharacterized protein n=1 Tax=Daldinia caldariorum TaxID=326644 RepID=UPI002007FAA9|nr:uncharacterized protein F4812DRAFT_191330 [Daldinia caldariorum]KAI1471760.1 hypothetical protein F4812DRAFT_191330 [Daldinia caldariorum]